jgi:hypothetical protein
MAWQSLLLLATENTGLTPAGWTMMIGSNIFVLVLTFYCVIKVMLMPAESLEEDMHGFTGIDTGDTVDMD